ncbi:MAG: polyprenyl synthetase family protein [Lachnospiraceae bacterium]|nr:polyprenyl synthetase family protein [Lachnospiraceae bacterium]
MALEETIKEKAAAIDEIVAAYTPEVAGFQKTLFEAMDYSLQAGGKRLRPMLMQESFAMFGGNGDSLQAFMAAQEMIHTYSLIHDDLPAMDNDDYRRGRKTNHVVFGEAMAILAGDGLLNYAYEVASASFLTTKYPERVGKALHILAKKAGVYGMVGGQAVDVEAEKKDLALTEDTLLFIHENKTAALIQSSLMIGAVLAGATDEEVAKLEKAGYDIGIAFQIQDDILDVIGDEAKLGKPLHSDEKNGKLTYVSAHGLEESKKQVEAYSEEAIRILQGFGHRNLFLEELVKSLISREK